MKQPDGSIRTEEVRIEGPIMLFLTTTRSGDGDAELENRCIKLSVDEDVAQTAAIHAQQRSAETWAGLETQATAAALRRLHQNAQRLLRPVAVINPFAPQLGFATHQARLRRDHRKYLDLIKAVTFLHQFQRPRETRMINGERIDAVVTTPADIALANELAHVVLGRSLDDLPPQARRLLGLLYDVVGPLAVAGGCVVSQFDWSVRQVLPQLPLGNTQLRRGLAVLIDHDYLVAHRRHATLPMQYRLTSDDRPDAHSHHCLGLIDPNTICNSDAPFAGPERSFAGPDAPFATRLPAVYRPFAGRLSAAENPEILEKSGQNGQNRHQTEKLNGRPSLEVASVVDVVGHR